MAIKKIRPLGLLARVDHHITHPIRIDSRAKHFYPTSGSCVSNKDSKLRGACHRAVAYEYWNTPVTSSHSPETMYTFELGRQIESMFIEWFKEMGIYAGDHIKFYNADFHVSGELDGVLRESPGSDSLFGWECK